MQTIAHTWTRARALVCVFLLSLVPLANATVCQQWRAFVPNTGGVNPPGPFVADKPSACSAVGGTFNAAANGGQGSCQNVPTNFVDPVRVLNVTWSFEGRNGDFCGLPDACSGEATHQQTTNYTVGWVKNPNAEPVDSVANMVGNYSGPKLGAVSCVPVGAGFCNRAVLSAPSAKGFVSLEPGPNGLYRMSLDFVTEGLGTTCTPGPADASADPATPPLPCPGQAGVVNGKPACLPAPAAPGASSPTPLPGPANPASAPAAGTPYNAGNPSAGDKPPTGPGSGDGGAGRTPAAGSGGNNGGSSTAANGGLGGSGVGGGGSNTPGAGGAGTGSAGDGDKPRDPCGLPGTPPCKIDETGTPNGTGAYDAANATVAQSKTAAIDGVTGIGTNRDNGGFGSSWFPAMPSGCVNPPGIASAFGFALDICGYRPVIWDLMSLVWIACTLLGCAWMMYDTIAKGG